MARFVSWIWGSDPFVRAFEQSLQGDLSAYEAEHERLFHEDLDALHEVLRQAYVDENLAVFLSGCEVLRRHDALTPKLAMRYRRQVTRIGRYSAALEVLRDERLGARVGDYWFELAAACLAGGRLEEASRAIRKALEEHPDRADWQDFAARLRGVAKLGAAAPAWKAARRILDFLLVYQQPDLAARLLTGWLWRCEPLGGKALAEPLDFMGSLFHRIDAHRSAALLAALERHASGEAQGQAIRETIQAMVGRDPALSEPADAGRDLDVALALAGAGAGAWDQAVARLGRVSLDHKRDLTVRNAMARCVGRLVLAEAPLRFRPRGGPRRIFNLVPYNGERMMLDLRLKTMGDWVDTFVIVESSLTFTGQPKPLHFLNDRERFAAHADRILHVAVEDFPACVASPWGRDFYQRDKAIAAISGLCAEDDLVLLTDADEIVRQGPIEAFDGEFAGLRMETFRYFLNNRLIVERDDQRGAGAVWTARHLAHHGSSYARFVLSQYDPGRWIHDAGWHFTSIMDAEELEQKIKSYAHQEYAHRDQSWFGKVLDDIRAGRMDAGWERIEIDDRFPEWIRNRRRELAPYIL